MKQVLHRLEEHTTCSRSRHPFLLHVASPGYLVTSDADLGGDTRWGSPVDPSCPTVDQVATAQPSCSATIRKEGASLQTPLRTRFGSSCDYRLQAKARHQSPPAPMTLASARHFAHRCLPPLTYFLWCCS